MRFLLLFLFLHAPLALAATQVYKGTPISAVDANNDYSSAAINTDSATSGSFHCTWAGLTGTLDGTFTVEVSNDGGTSWVEKTGADITVSGDAGGDVISLNGVVTENKYRIVWADNNVSAGTVNCYAVFKG